MKKKEFYYIVELEVSLKNNDYVFGFINISHIPYSKFEEIFKDQITDERSIFDYARGYEINEKLYEEYKDFFDSKIHFGFDFDIFKYHVCLSVDKVKNYEKNYYDDLPSPFKRNK
jgi:hypothetical protein